MNRQNEVVKLVTVGIIAAFSALAFVGTTIIRVPIPASGGYFNLGDTFVMIAALLYGPKTGAIVGLIGPTISDAIGFPQFIPATAIVKCLEGWVVGMIGYHAGQRSFGKPITALIAGTLVLVCGYFVFEAVVYPFLAKAIPFFGVTDFHAAIAEIIPNLLQGLISSVLAFGVWRILGQKNMVDPHHGHGNQ